MLPRHPAQLKLTTTTQLRGTAYTLEPSPDPETLSGLETKPVHSAQAKLSVQEKAHLLGRTTWGVFMQARLPPWSRACYVVLPSLSLISAEKMKPRGRMVTVACDCMSVRTLEGDIILGNPSPLSAVQSRLGIFRVSLQKLNFHLPWSCLFLSLVFLVSSVSQLCCGYVLHWGRL